MVFTPNIPYIYQYIQTIHYRLFLKDRRLILDLFGSILRNLAGYLTRRAEGSRVHCLLGDQLQDAAAHQGRSKFAGGSNRPPGPAR